MPASLDEALDELERDHDFLTAGDVFTPDLIETWIRIKRENEIDVARLRPTPTEFELYFDLTRPAAGESPEGIQWGRHRFIRWRPCRVALGTDRQGPIIDTTTCEDGTWRITICWSSARVRGTCSSTSGSRG